MNANLARAAIIHFYMSNYAASHVSPEMPKEQVIKVLQRGRFIAEEALKL